MTISFTRTRQELARAVLRKLGVLASGGSDVSADMDVCYEAMDLRLKSMHARGIFWRKVDKVPFNFSLSAGIVSASATSDILFPISMTVPDGSADSPVQIIGVREYAAIADKTETGLPEKALWKGGGEFLFWPVPDTAGTAKLVYEKVADDTSAGAAPDVEVSMLRWMRDLVAYDVSDDFMQSEQKIGRLAAEAAVAERMIRALNDQRTNLATVAVDEFRGETQRRETDYGW